MSCVVKERRVEEAHTTLLLAAISVGITHVNLPR